MTQSLVKIKELDGKQLYYSFLAGAQRIFDNQKYLNKINVFPVADADTGTNLASTMRSIMDAVIPTDNPKQTAVAIADVALTGARGNSGIIFAQFLYGFSNEIQHERALDVRSFADSMRKAVAYAYEAIANPVEGTILTVIKDWAEYLYYLKDVIDDFIEILIVAYNRAQQSLANTTRQLEVLAKSHVVDAGAKGFVVFLEGFLDFLTKGDPTKSIKTSAVIEEATIEKVSHEVITFRYCSEAMVNGVNFDHKKIRESILSFGDSLVIAGTQEKMRIHIHTDHPAELFAQLQEFGNITYQKVDDMIMQNEILNNRKAGIALVTDSCCDIPDRFLDQYQIHMVPLSIHFGSTFFLDRLTIQPSQFYTLMSKTGSKASTAQPSIKDFQNKYEYLATHYESIIGINVSGGLSGTFNSSFQAAKEVRERNGGKISIFNSKNVTGGLGLIILRASQAIEEGILHDELALKIEEWIQKSHIRVSVTTLKYIIQSGRVNPLKGFIAKTLDLKPIIIMDKKEGKAETFSKSFSEKGTRRKVMRNISKIAARNNIWNYIITHAGNPKTADWYAIEMEKLTGKKPIFVDHASPALVANTGPGVVCVAFMLE